MRTILFASLIAISLLLSNSVRAGATQWMDFTLEDGHIYIDITLNGKPSKAFLDTGSQMNAISSAYIAAVEPDFTKAGRTRVIGAFGEDIRDRFNGVPVTLFGIDLELNGLVSLNIGDEEHALLLGAGFFDDFVTQIDYPNQRIRLIQRDSIKLSELRNVRVEKDASSRMPIVNVTLNKQDDVWLMLDTGMNGGILVERRIARNNDWLSDKFKKVTSDSSGVTRNQQIESFLLPSVVFGPFELENVIVSTPSKGQDITIMSKIGQKRQTGSRIKGNRVEGLRGYDVLKHFVITIDYERGYMHVGLPEDI